MSSTDLRSADIELAKSMLREADDAIKHEDAAEAAAEQQAATIVNLACIQLADAMPGFASKEDALADRERWVRVIEKIKETHRDELFVQHLTNITLPWVDEVGRGYKLAVPDDYSPASLDWARKLAEAGGS